MIFKDYIAYFAVSLCNTLAMNDWKLNSSIWRISWDFPGRKFIVRWKYFYIMFDSYRSCQTTNSAVKLDENWMGIELNIFIDS